LARCPSWRLGSTLSFGVSLQSTGLTPNQEDIHLEMDLGPALLDVVGVQGLLSWSMLHPMCQATMQLSNSKAPLGANFSFGQSFLVVAGLRTGCSSMDYKIVAHAPCACKCQKRSTICCSPVYSVKKVWFRLLRRVGFQVLTPGQDCYLAEWIASRKRVHKD
jgi:hypothetical protein